MDCPHIAEFHALITEMAFKHSYSLSHWQSSLQVLLEKNPGSIHIADICALGLLEANLQCLHENSGSPPYGQTSFTANLIPQNVMAVSMANMPSRCPLAAVYW